MEKVKPKEYESRKKLSIHNVPRIVVGAYIYHSQAIFTTILLG